MMKEQPMKLLSFAEAIDKAEELLEMEKEQIVFKEETKQETLEEAAEKYADFSNDYVPMSFGDKFNETTKRDFIAGAKWYREQLKGGNNE